MVGLLSVATSLASKFVPSLIGKLTNNDGAEEVAEKVVNVAKNVTGKEDPKEAEEILSGNPDLALEFQKEVHTYEISLAREETERIKAINRTMQAESKGEGIQSFWRPFNGVMFAITLFLDYFGSQVAMLIFDYIGNGIPNDFSWTHIPAGIYSLWALVLGVYVVSRGKEKVTQTKATALGSKASKKDLVKEFGKGIIGNIL